MATSAGHAPGVNDGEENVGGAADPDATAVDEGTRLDKAMGLPYVHALSTRAKERRLREWQRQATASARPPPKGVRPRDPRYMRPSTGMSKVRRTIHEQGLPIGRSVVSLDAYHDRHCREVDAGTVEGQMRLASLNSRYAKFWTQVPELLAATQRRHEKRHQQFRDVQGGNLHRYFQVKPVPKTLQDCAQTHLRDMQKLYDKIVLNTTQEDDRDDSVRLGSDGARGQQHLVGLCPRCGADTIHYRFSHQCPTCHWSIESVCIRDRNIKEYDTCAWPRTAGATYKRINHFNEWLLRTQGLEQRQVPPAVLDAVRRCLTLAGRSLTEKSPPKMVYMNVRNALARARYQDFFEHVPQIIEKVVGLSPPRLTEAENKDVRALFMEIQAPFDRVKPPERRNFLSYAYVIFKICELLEIDRILPFCPLFKSVQNQRNADAIWRKICAELNYEYIPTV